VKLAKPQRGAESGNVRGGLTPRGPAGEQRGEITHSFSGLVDYRADPEGHWLEIITLPYGGWEGTTPARPRALGCSSDRPRGWRCSAAKS